MIILAIHTLYEEQSENPHHSQKHQIHRAVGDTDQLVTLVVYFFYVMSDGP